MWEIIKGIADGCHIESGFQLFLRDFIVIRSYKFGSCPKLCLYMGVYLIWKRIQKRIKRWMNNLRVWAHQYCIEHLEWFEWFIKITCKEEPRTSNGATRSVAWSCCRCHWGWVCPSFVRLVSWLILERFGGILSAIHLREKLGFNKFLVRHVDPLSPPLPFLNQSCR